MHLGLVTCQEICTSNGEGLPDKNWIKILFIFNLVYKRAKKFCEKAQGSVSKWFYDTSTGAATGAVPLWFFCWRGIDRSGSWLSGNTVDTKIYVVRAAEA
jgi:hypothetical protein